MVIILYNEYHMSKQCNAMFGYLVPRQSCQNPVDTACHKCQCPLCHEHAKLVPEGILCPTCALPTELNAMNLKKEIYFTEQELTEFAEAWQKQRGKQDAWVEFT